MRALFAIVLLAGCRPGLATEGLPSAEGYETWYRVDRTGAVSGHGDTYREIFVNDVGRSYPHGGRYAIGTVVVKEIRAVADGGGPGSLRYSAVARKVGEDADVEADVDGGWIWSRRNDDGDEVLGYRCWQGCHTQAPVDGMFYDYGE